jgi:hypothetical protein
MIRCEMATGLIRTCNVMVALCLLSVAIATSLFFPDEAQAIPAFARKYNVNCTVCHTAPPLLNPFGQRFLENGYQLPGTEDGGIIGKRKLGDVTLDDVSNYVGVGLFGTAVRHWDFTRQNPPGATPGVVQNKTEFGFPAVVELYVAGTATKNIGFFNEVYFDVRGGGAEVERSFVTVNNLGSHNWAHVRVGKFDPSAYFSYGSERQQIGNVGDSRRGCASFAPCAFNRIGLGPSAFATKFYGLYDRSGNFLSPFTGSLYHSDHEVGIDVHGRPFGDWFLYQVGILNGAGEPLGDSNKGKDIYGMVRFDYAKSQNFSASLSGFLYHGNSNVRLQTQENVNWNRYGVSARVSYKMVDAYAAFSIDQISNLPVAAGPLFDKTATGLTLGVDAYVTSKTMASLRYDNLDAGGMLNQRMSTSFLSIQARHYLRTNISVFARGDFNLREAANGDTAAQNLRQAFFSGIALIF